MKAVLQRVRHAQVTVDGEDTRAIGPGLLILLGVAEDDTLEDAALLALPCEAVEPRQAIVDNLGEVLRRKLGTSQAG